MAHQKKISAKQLAARHKFALAAKARAKTVKLVKGEKGRKGAKTRAKNKTIIKAKTIQHLDVAKVHNGKRARGAEFFDAAMRSISDYSHVSLSNLQDGIYYGQQQIVLTKRGQEVLAQMKRELARRKKKSRARNKTVIVKPKRVLVLNPGSTVRRKIRNSYVSLRVHGYAKKTPKGWSFASKTYPQGSGIVPVTKKGFYLDKATGAVFSRQAKNPGADFLLGPKRRVSVAPGVSASTRAWTEWGARRKARRLVKKANPKASPKIVSIREMFSGQPVRQFSEMVAPDGTPKTLAKLGKLKLIKAPKGKYIPLSKRVVWLCCDTSERFHLTADKGTLYEGPKFSWPNVSQIEYEEQKPHLGYPTKTIFFHKMGEEGGKKPTLIGDGKGGLKLRGGSYRIEREGIVD